jgi:hypothetical protein
MDDIKDIQKTDTVSRFIDSHNVRTNPFGDNRAAERAYRKAERISAALYLLTNHIPSSESIREAVRSETHQLLDSVLRLRDEMRAAQSSAVHGLQVRLRHLISLVRILSVAGNISMQNAGTAIEALDELGNFLIASQRSILSENITISRDELMDVHGSVVSQRATPVRSTKDVRESVIVKDTSIITDTSNASDKNTNGHDAVSVRVQSILEILRVGGSLGIKDIAANLPEYSEKMIQRELLDLAAKGAIRKIGLKRWSKYSLAV